MRLDPLGVFGRAASCAFRGLYKRALNYRARHPLIKRALSRGTFSDPIPRLEAPAALYSPAKPAIFSSIGAPPGHGQAPGGIRPACGGAPPRAPTRNRIPPPTTVASLAGLCWRFSFLNIPTQPPSPPPLRCRRFFYWHLYCAAQAFCFRTKKEKELRAAASCWLLMAAASASAWPCAWAHQKRHTLLAGGNQNKPRAERSTSTSWLV
jgi:hypothetical protein